MNKYTKGSIAAGAGLILLLGGAGTFMSWNDQEDINGGPVTAGDLRLTSNNDGVWTVGGEKVTNISAFRIAPGDIAVYTTTLAIEAEGDNLTADLNLTEGAIAAGTTDVPADAALANQLRNTAALTLVPTNPAAITDNGDSSYTINASGGPVAETATVTVTLNFPFNEDGPEDNSGDDAAMNGQVSLDGMNVSLTQNLNPA